MSAPRPSRPSREVPPPTLAADVVDLGPVQPPSAPATLDLLHEPLPRLIVRLALPAVGTTLLQVLFNICDTFWVGRLLGPTALAGVSIASYGVWMTVAVGELIGVGLTAVAARRHGERRPGAAAEAAGTALWLALLLGLVVALGGRLGLSPLLALMGTTADVAEVARQFLLVQLYGAVLVYGYYAVAAAFRSAGDTRTPFFLLGASVLLNLVLDPLMIAGWGTIPGLGVYGAALATVLTRGLGCLIGLVLLIRRDLVRPAFRWEVARRIARVGLPTMLTGVLFSLIYVLLTRFVAGFGTPALAALGLGHRIEGVTYMIGIGFALAAETIVGQNLGGGKPERARAAGWRAAQIASVPIGALGLVFLLAPELLAGIFTDDPTVIRQTALYLRIIAVGQLALALETVLEGALSGAGYTFWTMVWIVGLSAIRIPLAAVVAPEFGLAGIWWLLLITAVARAAALATLWASGRWARVAV